MRNMSGSYNIYIGESAGYYQQTGSNNTIIGFGAGNGSNANWSGSNNLFLGTGAGC